MLSNCNIQKKFKQAILHPSLHHCEFRSFHTHPIRQIANTKYLQKSDSYPPLHYPNSSNPPTSSQLRSSFLNYFSKHNHLVIPSSSLIPSSSDDSLLFTNAGMVPLKDMLLGNVPPPPNSFGKLTSVQKCIRAGGKHNDLENVGYTARHHTFFEMLGNFSIGAYFKEEAMVLAWNYITKELQIPPSRLRITVLRSDDQSARLWHSLTGFSESSGQLIRMDENDNFWSMGDSPGIPCGPCSEIFYDQGYEIDGERYLEIWNLVFMEYARGMKLNELIPLEKPCVDTGMGLERLTAVMQGVPTNYDTDLLKPLILETLELARRRASLLKKDSSKWMKLLSTPYKHGLDKSLLNVSLKVIVDHLRSSSFLISEGIVPSNLGRGYVLRRIIRRAIRYAHQGLGINEPFMSELIPILIQQMGTVYPELIERKDVIKSILTIEETNFFTTLSRGLSKLEEAFNQHKKNPIKSSTSGKYILSGETAFMLYDSFGFPLDLTQIIVRERRDEGINGWDIDIEKFDILMKQQKEQSKGTAFQTSSTANVTKEKENTTTKADTQNNNIIDIHPSGSIPIPSEVKSWHSSNITSEFIGYTTLEVHNPIINGLHYSTLDSIKYLWISLNRTPFYANAGGQIGDKGILKLNEKIELNIVDCIKPYEGLHVMRTIIPDNIKNEVHSVLKVGSTIPLAMVDSLHRSDVAAHHTATHLLHAALKKILGGENNSNDTNNTDTASSSSKSSSSSSHKKKSSSSTPVLSASAINQSGSLVSSDRFRFDFSCPFGLNEDQLNKIEKWMNDVIFNAPIIQENNGNQVIIEQMTKEEAMKKNAMSLFGEKYGSIVRVVSIPGYSIELCGGTHVSNLRSCYPIKLLNEFAIASGMRRIEGIAGRKAIQYLEINNLVLKNIAKELKCTTEQIQTNIKKLLNKNIEYENIVNNLYKKIIINNTEKAIHINFKDKEGHSYSTMIHEIPVEVAADGFLLRSCCTALSDFKPSSAHILLCSSTGTIAVSGINSKSKTKSKSTNEIDKKEVTDGVLSPLSAKVLLAELQNRLTASGAIDVGKGGGNELIAVGVVPIKYKNETNLPLIQRIRDALSM